MGKYSAISNSVFSIFSTTQWKAENIKTFPENFVGDVSGGEYIRIAVLANGSTMVNPLKSVSGLVLIEIYTPAGFGPSRTNLIADKLDTYLVGKAFSLNTEGSTQFGRSYLAGGDNDKINPSLYRDTYTIHFNYFGV